MMQENKKFELLSESLN